MPARIVVEGLAAAEAELSPERFHGAIAAAFDDIGVAVEEYSLPRIEPKHRWQGTMAATLHHAVSSIGGRLGEETTISLEGPQVRSFEGGWFSKGGHQPPTEQIAAWLASKGKDPAGAFAVARAIGGRSIAATAGTTGGLVGSRLGRLGGYRFGKLRIFPTASWVRPRAMAIISDMLRVAR